MDENQQYKQMIQTAFDTVAPGYDHPSLAFFPDTAHLMIQYLDLAEDLKLLDVCTGTGMVALNAARQLPQGQVTGIDLSSGMLCQASEKAAQYGLTNTQFIHMDLDHLDLPAQSYDVATSSFGLFFLTDMMSAMNTIAETIRPGGRIAISSFTGQAFDPFSSLFLDRYAAFGMEIPDLSWKRLASEDNIRAIYHAAGIDNIRFFHEPLGYDIETAQDWWDVVWNAGYRGLLNQLTPEQQVLFRDQHFAEIDDLLSNGKVRMDTHVIIAIGQKT